MVLLEIPLVALARSPQLDGEPVWLGLGVQLPVVEKLLQPHRAAALPAFAGVYQRHDFADEKAAGAGRPGRTICSRSIADRC